MDEYIPFGDDSTMEEYTLFADDSTMVEYILFGDDNTMEEVNPLSSWQHHGGVHTLW